MKYINLLIILIFCAICLGLIYKIARLEEVNGQLRQQYEKVCTQYGGNGCE